MISPIRAATAWCTRAPDRAVALLLALASYVPILLTSPGQVSADTKTYLTLDPGSVLSQAASMWDPTVGAGTVPHQNIGYLFPLGPYYWVMEQIGIPDWLTQRLLWGTLVFAAAYGMYRLARWIGWGPTGALVSAFAYGFSPYLLSYLARLSVILGPWAALPWMILLAAKAARTRSWRPAAQFAVVVALVGSVNATALVLAGLGPVIWLIADVVSGRVSARSAARAAAMIGSLAAAVSVWWIAALRIQGSYGIPILRYTETYESVASASTPAELVRGLGYWFFYGGDRLDSWVGPSLPYIDRPVLIALGFALAGTALLGFLVAFAGRATAAVLLLIGLAVSVGAAPLGSATPYGAVFDWFASDTTAGLALRSTPRAAPLLILALAFGLGSSSEWLRTKVRDRTSAPRADSRRWDLLVPVGALALLAVQLFPWFTADSLTPSLLRDETLPAYETELATWLDATRDPAGGGRVYELPAADFANYRWGGTVDPALPGLIERPYIARELVPQGGAGTADLLNAFERRLPEGWFEPETLALIARRLGVDTVVTRNDLQHERYRLARPGQLWTDVTGALGDPNHAGPVTTDQPVIPLIDERTLAHPEAATEFPVVAAFDLSPAPPVAAVPADSPIVLAGSGDGIVDMAGAGLLDPERPLLYAATLADLASDGEFERDMIGEDPWWVVSDTNRRQGRHWSTISSNLGALETAEPIQIDPDPGNNQLDVFDDKIERQTIGVHRGDVEAVRASYYGYRVAYIPEDAPRFALDGDPTTAWRAGVFEETSGLVWEVDLREPTTASTITVLQPISGALNRYITKVRVTLDDETSFDVLLDESSRSLPGQVIELPGQPFDSLRIEILADNLGELSSYIGQPGVGFAEIVIPGVTDDYVVQLPDLAEFEIIDVDQLAQQQLTYLLTRQRIDPASPNQSSAEPFMVREIQVPDARSFAISGEVRLSAEASDSELLTVLDDPSMVIANRRLRGTPDARGASAFDGDYSTAWQTPFGGSVGAELTINHVSPVEASSVTVTWFDDGLHSVPSELTMVGDDGIPRVIFLPPTPPVNGIASTTVDVPAYVSSHSVITVSAITEHHSPEYFSGLPQELPIAISEIQLGNTPNPVFDRTLPISTECRRDLVVIDGTPIPFRVLGTREDALTRSELVLEACTGTLDTDAGTHRVDAIPGSVSGFDVDRLVLDSHAREQAPRSNAEAPATTVVRAESTEFDLRVGPSNVPSWLVLEQSWNAGWHATVDGEGVGAPVLINGYANGWLLPPGEIERSVELRWEPQQTMRLALWFSLLAGIGVIALLVFARRPGIEPVPDADVGAAAAKARERRRQSPLLAGALVAVVYVVAGPVAALCGVVTLLIGPRWRWLAPAVVLLTGGVVAGSIIALEWRHNYPPGPDWPDRFGWTSPLVWIAVSTVVISAIMPRGVRRPGSEPSSPEIIATPHD